MKLISGERVIYSFENEMDYVDRVEVGEEFLVETNDCFFQQITSEKHIVEKIDHDKLNPATGPIYIEGAEVGDILRVDILDIEVAEKGAALTIPGGGALGDLVEKPITKIIEIEDGFANYQGVKIPIKPMIGVIGVATDKEDGSCSTDTPYKHGGNMDTKEITKGCSLYFPVKQEGALLALGDLHAVMGDGELCFTGLEIPGRVTLKTNIIKSKDIEWPILETEDETLVIASGETIESALHSATSTAVTYLSRVLEMSFEEAYVLGSLTMDARISQVVNPLKTVRASIPKYIVTTEEIIEKL